MENEVDIQAVEALGGKLHPLRRYRFAYRRLDGARQELKREVFGIGGCVAVLPYDPRRSTVLLTRQFRFPAHVNGDAPRMIEACAGIVEGDDDPPSAVRKEAQQEMGCALRNLRKVFTLYTSPGATTEKLHFFAAEYDPGERSGDGGGLQEEGEDIEVLELPLTEAVAMIEAGQIIDAKTIILLQYLAARQPAQS